MHRLAVAQRTVGALGCAVNVMWRFSRFTRLVLVLCTGTTVIFCFLLLFSDRFTFMGKLFLSTKYHHKEQFKKIGFPESYLLERDFTDEQIRRMSPLGKWLLAPEGNPTPSNITMRNYLILIWKYGLFLERRHIRRFTHNKLSPWDGCSVQNCILSYDDADLSRADAVIFHLHFTKSVSELPERSRLNQRWIFLTDESPIHTFLYKTQRLSDYDGLFNWSMSYRMDSDVPVPYGRTIRLTGNSLNNNIRHWETTVNVSKSKLVAIMGSNCGSTNGRWFYVNKLKSLLGDDLDVLGRCLNGNRTICPGHFDTDCVALNAYKFYLSFENSNCREYFTEKVFWNGYRKFAVPIIMGASKLDCKRLLPPRSFLHVDDFASVEALADYLRYLDRNNERYLKYHEWRDSYKVINEHGYFGSASKHYCRVCEALHYNPSASKVYEKLEEFWNKNRDCVY